MAINPSFISTLFYPNAENPTLKIITFASSNTGSAQDVIETIAIESLGGWIPKINNPVIIPDLAQSYQFIFAFEKNG